jgi:hypothetical protein
VGSLERKFGQKNPHSLDKLKQNIKDSILNVMTKTVHNIFGTITKRVDARVISIAEIVKILNI